MKKVARLVLIAVVFATTACGNQARLASSCSPDYPDICVFTPTDRLSCSSTTSTHFIALRDSANLDSNGDGIACGDGDVSEPAGGVAR